jgi:hypothetical protein
MFLQVGFWIMPAQRHRTMPNEEQNPISSNGIGRTYELLCESVVDAVFANGVKSLQEGAESLVRV